VAKGKHTHKLQDQPYPRPVIAEALCEVHFEPTSAGTKDLGWVETFHKAAAKDYAERENKELVDFRAQISPSGVAVLPPLGPVQRTVLRHADKSHIVQLSPGLMAVNETARYPGWRTFKGHIRSNWERLAGLGEPRSVRRIGLRYINRIERHDANEPINAWITESGYVPPLLLDCTASFLSRFEHRLDDARRLIVTVAEEETGGAGPKPIIFDIDAIKELSVQTDWNAVEPALDQLHDVIWDAFRGSASEALIRHMEGETR
jgi:uncharacterized protein (TIGR04255 family)